ncbi:MAG: PspC domain-containing protein [Chloroflexi bacterium]|nr:PspC domain-containing protein [Chloroflexota bacterium]
MNAQRQQLRRSSHDRLVAGVCGGLAAYFAMDATIVRLVWAAITVFTGVLPGLIIYLLLVVILPVGEPGEGFDGDAGGLVTSRTAMAGLLLVLAGGLLLLTNFGFFDWLSWGRLWPILLIVLGGAILLRRR